MGINVRIMRQEIVRQSDRTIRPAIERAAKLAFKEKQADFMANFEAHKVTQEIQAGPTASSSIPSIAETGGNLFSLIGFYKEQNPIGALRAFLKKSVKIGKTRRGVLKGNRMVFSTPVEIPTADEIDAAMASNSESSLEWTDRSFTSLLANGITGLPKYLFNLSKRNKGGFAASRSGPAIQATKTVRTGTTGPIPYISDILGYLKRLIATGSVSFKK